MKIVKNLLAAAILTFAIASSTYAGDVGFPPGVQPTPQPTPLAICSNSTPVVGPNGEIIEPPADCVPPEDEVGSYLIVLALLVALSLLPKP